MAKTGSSLRDYLKQLISLHKTNREISALTGLTEWAVSKWRDMIEEGEGEE